MGITKRTKVTTLDLKDGIVPWKLRTEDSEDYGKEEKQDRRMQGKRIVEGANRREWIRLKQDKNRMQSMTGGFSWAGTREGRAGGKKEKKPTRATLGAHSEKRRGRVQVAEPPGVGGTLD